MTTNIIALIIIIAALLLAGWVSPNPAHSHLAYKPKRDTLQHRAHTQTRNLSHARYVARHGQGTNRRWHLYATTWLSRELEQTRQLLYVRSLASPQAAICHVFGQWCSQALSVAWCESRMWVGAQNGQYLGLFQMGDYARSAFGHGQTALEQARAAYRYFVASGYTWAPWACRP